MWRFGGIASEAEMVPVSAIRHLREFDRRPGSPEANNDLSYWDSLKQHIALHGFEDPLTLEYNNLTGQAKIGEGNHRLQVADELGLTHVPVHVVTTQRDLPRAQYLTEPNAYPSDEYGYFPSHLKPSDIGLPVSDEPYTQAPTREPTSWYPTQYPEKFSAAEKKDELHVGLDIPKQAAIEIHNWVEEQDWPKGTELESIEDYHITMLWSSSEGASDHREDDWIKHERHAVTIKALKEFPPSEEKDGLHPIVLLVEGESLQGHHDRLADGAEAAGVEISPYSHDKYKPHITIGYAPSMPKGLKPPKFTFETDESKVNPPRTAASTSFPGIQFKEYGPRATPEEIAADEASKKEESWLKRRPWIFDPPSNVFHIGAPGWHHDEIQNAGAPQVSRYGQEGYEWTSIPGDPEGSHVEWLYGNGDPEVLQALSEHTGYPPSDTQFRFTHHLAPYMAQLVKFADSWDPQTVWPNELREQNGEVKSGDCTCKDGHKLDCPLHGMHPVLPTWDDTLEFPNPSSPVGYDYHADGPRTWMRAETKTASHQLAWLPHSGLAGKGLVTPTGDVHTWPVDPKGMPGHAEYLDSRAPYQLGEGNAHFFNIRPRGGLDTKGHNVPAQTIRHILKVVPSLRPGEHTDWHFGFAPADGDSRQYDDSLMMPPMTQAPDATNPHPEKAECTCSVGKKLTCPIHGMNPSEPGKDHSWSIPQGHPVGYPQSQPQNYIKAEGSIEHNPGSPVCVCPACVQAREHEWHIQSPGSSDQSWSGLPRAEGAVDPIAVHHIGPEGGDRELGSHDISEEEWKNGEGADQSKPFIYVPQHKSIYVGNPGWYHDDIEDGIFGIVRRVNDPLPPFVRGRLYPDGGVHVYDSYVNGDSYQVPLETEEEIHGALGGQGWDPNKWDFQASADEDEHGENLEGDGVELPEEPDVLRKKQLKEKRDLELVQQAA